MEEKQEVVVEKRKKSLCRFYVRGLCIKSREDCHFSHGIDDIDYQYWHEGEIIEVDYLKDTEFTQKKAVKGPRVYINLYEFQITKKYTLEELNEQRPLRVEVRNEMHKKLFLDFMQLLESKFPGANLTEEMLTREYTRLGFNKLMTRIKFSHLTNAVCDTPNSLYFKKALVMPPLVKRQTTYIFRRASEEEILQAFKDEYKKIVEKGQIEESEIKKKLYSMNIPSLNIPPLTTILKERQLNFTDFLQILHGSSFEEMMQKVKLEAKPQQILEFAKKFLTIQSEKRLINWNDVYIHIAKQLKINNGNIINQVKPLLVLQGFQFMHFPMVQFIYNKQLNYNFGKQAQRVCTCNFQEKYNQQEIIPFLPEQTQQIQEGKSFEINSIETLQIYGVHILESKILAIDIQGNLRKGGFVQMLQLNNGSNTFLLDIYLMTKNQDFDTINLVKKILRNVLVNPAILKIFHDSRHDSLALHSFMQSCVINIFDTSASETLMSQTASYQELQTSQNKVAKAKSILTQCANIRTPGLNDIYQRYEASHGINKHKDRFHKMWSKGDINFFCKRPMEPDYRDYCVGDVLDLPEVYYKMSKKAGQTLPLCHWISANYISNGYQMSIEKSNQQQK